MSEDHQDDHEHDKHEDQNGQVEEQTQQITEQQQAPVSVAVPTMDSGHTGPKVELPKEADGAKFLNRVSIYWLELSIAMITLGLSASVLSYCVYALCSIGSVNNNLIANYGALWLAASAIVWVPVAFIFYSRARGYELRNRVVSSNPTQRTLAIFWQVLAILTTIGFAFSAVYTLLTALTQTKDMGTTLVTGTLPSFIAALIFGVTFAAFLRHPLISRKTFATVFLVISLIIVLPTIVMSILQIRQANSNPVNPNPCSDPYSQCVYQGGYNSTSN